MRFSWDEQKRHENIAKHGIDFANLAPLFDGPMLVQPDTRQDYGEDRVIGIGLLQDNVLVAVYVEWDEEDLIRLISARKATQNERKYYEQALAN